MSINNDSNLIKIKDLNIAIGFMIEGRDNK